jgi:hypothetical protein
LFRVQMQKCSSLPFREKANLASTTKFYSTMLGKLKLFHLSAIEHHSLHLLFHGRQGLHGGSICPAGALRRVVLGHLRLQIEPRPKRSKMRIVCRWHCRGSKDKDVVGSDLWDRYENLRILINKKLGNISVHAEKTYRQKQSVCTVRNCKISINIRSDYS